MVTLDECGWARSAARLWSPAGALGEYVAHAFVIDFRSARQRAWKILPDTCGHLLVKIPSGGAGAPGASVVGARSGSIEVDVASRAWTVGVRFRPGALAALARATVGDLTDRSVAPGALWGAAGDRFESGIRRTTDPMLVRRRLTAFLHDLVAPAAAPDWRAASFAALVHRSGGNTGIAEAATRMGVSTRMLHASATDLLGLPPKRYARIHRLFRAIEMGSELRWSRVAAGCGFADHSHLVREFRDLLGETPLVWCSRRSRATESVE